MSDELTIKTNNRPRALVFGYELSPKERAEFDYIKPDDLDCHEFVRYRGWTYDTAEFMRVPSVPEFSRWHGYISDSAFSGVLIRYTKDMESVVMARFYS
jgi:hypothetical protein